MAGIRTATLAPRPRPWAALLALLLVVAAAVSAFADPDVARPPPARATTSASAASGATSATAASAQPKPTAKAAAAAAAAAQMQERPAPPMPATTHTEADVEAGTDDFSHLVIQLADENFEKLTQAATGSTTGPWFVNFMSPNCYACQRFKQTWSILAAELEGSVNVAELDATASRVTARRFNITGYPTPILIRNGYYYVYEGFRQIPHLKDFALEKYKTAPAVPVRPEPGLWYGPRNAGRVGSAGR